jgi:hypothetical protein
MKGINGIILCALSLTASVFVVSNSFGFAADYYLHTTTTDEINSNPPTGTTAKFKDSPAVNRTTYQQIGIWSALPLSSPAQLQSLGSLVTWIGLKNSDDEGTYFDLRAEIRKNGAVIASGEAKGIQGVTRNPSLAKEIAVTFNSISTNQFAAGDVLSIRILTKVADTTGHNNAVGLRLYHDAVSRPSRFAAIFGSPPTKLVVTGVNGGINPVAGAPFSVTVQSQEVSGVPANVSSTTGVSLSLKIGNGTLGGTLSGTIAAATNQVTIAGASYTKAESGVSIRATRSGGDNLSVGESTPFTVDPGPASNLVFVTQPGSATAGSVIPGPPTVAVQDSLGNTVTSSTIYITVALGANPGGSTLSGNATLYTLGGVATFNDLSLNNAGTGYTLTASSTALAGATSSAFNITGPAGVILTATPTTRVAGNPFAVRWAQIANPTHRDWIGLYTPGSSETAYISYIYVSCTSLANVVAPSGTCQFATSNYLSAGNYEFRLFTNDSYTRIATSNPVTVTPGLILTASPSSVPAGATVTVTWSNNPNPTNTDGIRIRGISTGFIGERIYVSCTPTPNLPLVSGSCPYVVPTSPVPANYFFELLANDTNTVIATSNLVTVLPPSKLAIYASQNPAAGPPGFTMTVESQIASGLRANVLADTAVTVSLKTGSGVLSGTLSGTILTGTSQAVIGPATYTKAESGVVVTASRTSGDPLFAADSSPFTVNGGAPVRLVFVTQPGNTTVGSTIPGPPTVAFEDALGNITTSSAAVTIALGANPGAGTLDTDFTVTSGASVSFPSLSINQPGNGYTLTASSAGVVSATSNSFIIASAAGAEIIGGVITRVSNGATIAGALVEVYQKDTLRGTSVTDSSGNYSIAGLAAGSYTVRASFTGLVPQLVDNVSVIDSSKTLVNLSLNFGIAVQTPVAGATLNDFRVFVTGNFDTSLAPEVGINVNGVVGLIDGDRFATLVPVDPTVTTITAVATNFAGTILASDTVPVTVVAPSTDTVVHLIPSPPGGLAPLTVGFSLSTIAPMSQVALDLDGDGSIDFQGTSLTGQQFTYNEPGLYTPTVRVTDNQGQIHTAVTFVQVLDQAVLDTQLQLVWHGFKNALRSGDVSQAVAFLHSESRAAYQAKLALFNATTLANIDQYMTSIQLVEVGFGGAQYEMIRNQAGQAVSFSVWFRIDQDGLWRLRRF